MCQAFYIEPEGAYSLLWPIRHGKFNLADSDGGTLSSVIQDLTDLWSLAIEAKLDIPRKDLKVHSPPSVASLVCVSLGVGSKRYIFCTFGCAMILTTIRFEIEKKASNSKIHEISKMYKN